MVKLNKIFFGVECVFCGYLMRKKMIYVYREWMNKCWIMDKSKYNYKYLVLFWMILN